MLTRTSFLRRTENYNKHHLELEFLNYAFSCTLQIVSYTVYANFG
jgi:hypothetical protein